jgi:uncharacterized protein DUF4062
MQKKYQVFISSTFADLVDERQDTLKSVLDMGHIPSGMEVFPAVDLEQFEYIKKIIDECDYYVLIVSARYGSVDDAGVSFTEKEYHYAVSTKKAVLAFLHNDLGSVPTAKTDGDLSLQAKLETFRKIVATGRLVQFWSSRDDLKSKVIISLHKAMSDYPATGWMRADAAASEDLLAQINRLRVDNDELRSKAIQGLNQEEIDKLADFGSISKIRYSYDQYRKPNLVTLNDSVSITWKDLFVAVAPQFAAPKADGISASKLRNLFVENGLIPSARGAAQLFQTDLNTVNVQLHAYGLVSSEEAGTAEGSIARFTRLTPLGLRRQLEWSTVKSK